MQTRSVGVSLAADRPRERYHYDGMTSSVNLALRASPPGHIRAISLNSEENASPQGQNFPRQRTTYSRSRSTGSALPSTPLTALFTGSDRPQVAPGPSVVKVPSVLAIVTQFEDQASVYAASGGNSTHQRRPPTPPDASSYTRTSSFSSVVWPSPSTSRIAAVPRKTPFPNLDSVLPVGQKGRRPRRNLTRPSADVPALCSSVSNVTSNSNSISFEQSSPPHFSTAPSSVSSSVHSGPYHSHSSSSEAEAEIFPHDEISEQFRTILEDEDFDPPLAHGFRKVWKMLDSIGDALLVEMLPPNLGEVLPESLSSSELRSVQHVAYKVVSYLDALRRDMHVELRRVRKIHQLELPDLRRIKSYRDLSNACKVWRDRLSSFKPYPPLVLDLIILLPELYDKQVYHPFLALHNDFPDHNSWELSSHLSTLYAVIEDLVGVAKDLEEVASFLREEIFTVERKILRSGEEGKSLWDDDYCTEYELKKMDMRTGRR